MQDPEREALRASVEILHNCQAAFRRLEIVRVTSGSVTIERDVAVFELLGDSTHAPLAYAWTDPLVGDRTVNHQVVLHQGVVKSARHAVAGFFLSGSPAHTDGEAPEVARRVRPGVVGRLGWSDRGPNLAGGDAPASPD